MTPSPDTEGVVQSEHPLSSPTENTEELEELLDDLVDEAIEFGHADYTGMPRTTDEREADYRKIVVMKKRIASSNHQAVQAFGEKLLKSEKVEMYWDDKDEELKWGVPVSVITSLMETTNAKPPTD